MRRKHLTMIVIAVLAVSALVSAAASRDVTLINFDFQNATAGVGDNLGDRIVSASFLHHAVFESATFSWTDPSGVYPPCPPCQGSFYAHGVQNFQWDGPADNVYSARGTGPSPGFTHFVITLTAKKPWLLTGFSMWQAGNEFGTSYLADIIAVQGSASTALGTVSVGGWGAPTEVILNELSYTFDAGPMQILILPQVSSPTGSGYLAVDDINIVGTFHP